MTLLRLSDWRDETPDIEPCASSARPCPDRNLQCDCELVGYRMKSPSLLQLRVIEYECRAGVCEWVIDQRDDAIYARVLTCWEPGRTSPAEWESTDSFDGPLLIELDEPLAGRRVIDARTGELLPLYLTTPNQPGFRVVSQSSPEARASRCWRRSTAC